jgi:hypothetical protein
MLAEVGFGVAMAGAPEAVRAVARLVAPPVADEGAAQVLEELLLGGRPGTARGRMGENGAGGPPERVERRRSRE